MWLILLLSCRSPSEDNVVPVDIGESMATVDPRFLSFAMDTAQIVGGVFWNPEGTGEAEVPRPAQDLADPKLRTLAGGLAPSVLRIGGTAADTVYYDLSDAPADVPPEPYETQLTREAWDGLLSFVEDTQLDLLFTLNAGPGPRDADGVWLDDQARLLVEDAVAQDAPVVVWELGNEVHGFLLMHGLLLSTEQYARDLNALDALLDEVHPASLSAGPSSAYWPVAGELVVPFSEGTLAAGGNMGVFTWHYYPTQSTRCAITTEPASAEANLSAEVLAEVDVWAEEVEAHVDAHLPGVPIWLGESGNAQCGGEPGVSDTFAGSFWWIDQLGRIARRGHAVVIRQTLVGSDYGLLEDETLEPLPDYWVSLLWKQRMGTRVLDASVDADDVHVYAHCDASGVGTSFAVVHLGLDEVVLDFGWPVTAYRVEADGLDAREVRLEGVPLALDAEGGLPELRGTELSEGRVAIAGQTITFVHAERLACP